MSNNPLWLTLATAAASAEARRLAKGKGFRVL
jgi:hypothetical protein